MERDLPKNMHPLLRKVMDRIVRSGAGEVYIKDGHMFVLPCVHIKHFWGAMDMKKEGQAAGVRIVVRKVSRRARNSRFAGMPWMQLYVLPIVQKNAQTMTDNERRTMELNRRAMKLAHAVERDPEQAARYHELHEAHKRNPEGYKKLYPNFFGFVYATIRMELEAQEAVEQSATQAAALLGGNSQPARIGIKLCVPSMAARTVRTLPVAWAFVLRTPYTLYRPRAA